ncbi:MAG: ATP-binding protein [Nanoarchaeota archaeon]
MIIEFKIKNYNSYKEGDVLSFERKSKEQTGTKFITKINGLDILKTSGLVGVNGSGKTSLLSGLNFMKEMVLNSQKHNVDTNIRYSPFITEQGKPTEFELTFISENKKYVYGFSYTNKKIVKEFAIVYETQKPKEIFTRDEDNLNKRFQFTNKKFEKELKLLTHSVIPQTLMLSRAVQLNSKTLKPIYDFFSKIIVINTLFNMPPDFELLKDKKLKGNLLDNLSFADFSISDLELVKRKIKTIELIQTDDKGTMNQKISEKEIMDLDLIHKHKNKTIKINFNAESSGTQKFILIFYNLLKLSKDSIILYDEIETSYNIEIVEFILNSFSKKDNGSQLLFTTHQPEVLNYLRSDQINIIEKDDSVSKIINLHNVVKNNPKINKDYGEYYREGVLGGFPHVYKENE